MTVLTGFRTERLVHRVIAATGGDNHERDKALEKLRALGAPGVDTLVEGLSSGDESYRSACAQILGRLITNESLALVLVHLSNPSTKIANLVHTLLLGSQNYSPNALIASLGNPDIPPGPVLDLLKHHAKRVDGHLLLRQAKLIDPPHRPTAYEIVGLIADESFVADIIVCTQSDDRISRRCCAELLGRFDRPDTRDTLATLLSDPERTVRHTALRALASGSELPDVRAVVQLLADSDLGIQSQAIDVLSHFHHPETLVALLPMLGNESQNTRRAVVEVLNAVADPSSVKDLLRSMRDDDWWVRTRAGDALVKIGGPKVFSAILELLRDKDEDIRRSAIEIVCSSDNVQAHEQVLASLDDADWWVRERAIDALASTGDHNVVPLLWRMLKQDKHTRLSVVNALAKLGDARAVPHLVPLLNDSDVIIQRDAMMALEQLANPENYSEIVEAITAMASKSDSEMQGEAMECLRELKQKFEQEARAVTATLQADGEDAKATAAPHFDVDALSPGEVLEDRYELLRRIGQGSYGKVLLFNDRVIKEPVVLKFIRSELVTNRTTVQRFVREIRLARRVTHQNVIRLHDLIQIADAAAISMEYFPSHTLSKELQAKTAIPWMRARKLLLQILAGLHAAHSAGVIHRDVKPANILVADNDVVKLVDFGISAVVQGTETMLTQTGVTIGTPAYFSPEQIRGGKVDHRSDIYSVGIVLYQMLTGTRPYENSSIHALMYQHLEGGAKLMHEVNPAVPESLSRLVRSAMTIDPAQRIQSINEFEHSVGLIDAELTDGPH